MNWYFIRTPPVCLIYYLRHALAAFATQRY